ncbi:MAG TPA: YlxR family protein [Actinomycetota bacterium]
MERRQPERTCVGCRVAGPKGEFLRLVRRADGSIRVDLTGRERGRGAYLHRTAECVVAGFRHGSVARGLRARLEPSEAGRLMEQSLRAVSEGT